MYLKFSFRWCGGQTRSSRRSLCSCGRRGAGYDHSSWRVASLSRRGSRKHSFGSGRSAPTSACEVKCIGSARLPPSTPLCITNLCLSVRRDSSSVEPSRSTWPGSYCPKRRGIAQTTLVNGHELDVSSLILVLAALPVFRVVNQVEEVIFKFGLRSYTQHRVLLDLGPARETLGSLTPSEHQATA